MGNQPSLPEMPPMRPPASSAAPPPAIPPMASQPRALASGAGRLRQVISYVGGASLGFVLLICAAQLLFRPGMRPTDLVSTIEAGVDLGVMNQKMGVAPGHVALTEADYQRAIAKAQREGQAQAELGFQRQLAAVQADKERVVQAYGTLYQRTNIIAQAGVQMEAQALQFRQQLIQQTNGGRAMVISIYDGLCALGDADSCEKARQARQGMIDESTSLTEGQLAQKVNELMAGIPDPASLVVHRDIGDRGAPAIDR